MSLIANNIRYLRRNAKMSQKQLGQLVNRAESTIQMWETDLRSPTMEMVRKLSNIFNVDINSMVYQDLSYGYSSFSSTEIHNPFNRPVVGRVIAGIPVDAIEEILDYEELDPNVYKNPEQYFGLQIKGDSMEPVFSAGDVAIVKQQPTVESGQIAIIQVNGDEATIKKVVHTDYGIVCKPINPAYEPLVYTFEDIENKPVTILGRVVELRKKF